MRLPKLLSLFLLLALPPAWAGPKTKSYDAPAKNVFAAALLAAREQYVVSDVDQKNLAFAFASGASFTSYGFNCNVVAEPRGNDKTKLILNVQKKLAGKFGESFAWGAGGRLAKKFFKEVAAKLKADAKPEAKPEAKPAKAKKSGS